MSTTNGGGSDSATVEMGDNNPPEGSMPPKKMSASSPKVVKDITQKAKETSSKASAAVKEKHEQAQAAAKKTKEHVADANVKLRTGAEIGKKMAVADVKATLQEVRSGEDGLGAVVARASEKNEKVDRALHCCNNVGFAWADRHRGKVMAVNVLLGIVCFGCTLCGAFGLGVFAMTPLPWGLAQNVALEGFDLTWFAIDGSNSTHASHSKDYARFFGAANTALHANIPGAAASSAFAMIGETSSPLANKTIMHVDWRLDQWGLCLSPVSADDRWLVDAFKSMTEPWYATDTAFCKEWTHIVIPKRDVVLGTGLSKCKAKEGVDGFSLIMATFGAFMQIFNPISRCKKKTDNHQKTVCILILIVSALPPLLGIINFSTGCLSGMHAEIQYRGGAGAQFATGAALFLVGALMLFPIAALHLIVPAGVSSLKDRRARDSARDSAHDSAVTTVATPVETTVEIVAERA